MEPARSVRRLAAAAAAGLRRRTLDAHGRVRRSRAYVLLRELSPRRSRRLARLATASRSVRTRILVAFAVLLALGLVNLLVFQRGAARRADVFDTLRRAIERHAVILEARNALETQHRQVRISAEVIGVDAEPPSDSALQASLVRTDSITLHLDRLAALSDPAGRPAVAELRRMTDSLAASWRRFYGHVGVEPVSALEEIYETEDPLARALLNRSFPSAIARERRRVDDARAEFIRVDRAASRTTVAIFLLSVLVGGVLAMTISRGVLRGIAALRLGAERVGHGDLDHRIRLDRHDELAEVAQSFNRMAERLRRRSREMEEQKKIAESLLLNILPARIAEELRRDGRVEPKYLPDTTILFADIVGFTRLSETLSTDRMVRLLDHLFTEFDRTVRSYQLEKLKTVGDAYLCAGGLMRDAPSHPIDVVMAAFDLVDAVARDAERERIPLAIRVGIHTGPVAAGVVGIDKFAFDVWGETVNFAARLQTKGEANRITVSASTYRRVKDFFTGEYAGRGPPKGEQALDMYVITGVHPEVRGEGRPPAAFVDRYRRRFGGPPAAYPGAHAIGLITARR